MPAIVNSAEAAALALGSVGIIRDGVMTRAMTDAERRAWDNALWLSTLRSLREDADSLADRLAEEANRCETRSLRYEQRGMAAEANAALLLAELYDAAAAGLVR